MTTPMRGLDIAKSVLQVQAANAIDAVQPWRKLRRGELIPFFEGLPRCTVIIQACGAAPHWACVLCSLGHEVA
jgi:transposase